MRSFLFIFKIIFILIAISSCVRMDVVDFNKDKKIRIINYSYQDAKTKLVNQKYHSKYNKWFEAECMDLNLYFLDCPEDKLLFTKKGLTRINLLKQLKTIQITTTL